MDKIDIGAIYTVAITLAIVISITWINIVTLDKARHTLFDMFTKVNIFIITISAIYFMMFSYEAFNNYEDFLLEKGSYDKYTIAFCIYYGIVQVGILIIYKLLRLIGRNRRMIRKL